MSPGDAPPGDEPAGQGHGSRPEAVRERLVLALMTEPTITAAAKKAGVSRATAFRWLTEAGFRAALQAAREAVLTGALQQLAGQAAAAVRTLGESLASANDGVRLRAAVAVLEQVRAASE